jgi:3-isopropylmalate/(R)-2-methylmalate dehydratase small subunit
MSYKGKAHKFGDNVNTDDIIAARYLDTTDPSELAGRCMEHIDRNFTKRVKPGDIIVAGKNFGCGSSREHAPVAIKACGVSCVIAESFARIFFRNSVNIGLAIIESPKAVAGAKSGDRLVVDTAAGVIKNLTRKKTYHAEKYPPFMQKIITAGGLMTFIKKRLK